MTIRLFTDNDKSQILELFEEFGDYFINIDPEKLVTKAPNYATHFYDEMVKNTSTDGVIFVAEDSETGIVGFIAGSYHDITPGNSVESIPHRKAKVLELFVDSEFRSQGIGKQLMQKLEEYFVENNCDVMNVEVFAPNESARNFYNSQGFKERNLDLMKRLK